ncbi:TPA: MerR family transcriptional regulator [Pseudomonas aeruginosa]|nr:MerR family transcriptional regulator [Pseudomonas aeruginosa]
MGTLQPSDWLLTTNWLPMNYTPQQVLSAIGIGQQTLRYWRKVLPPLANRQGHSACFSFWDLVALKAVNLLVAQAGVAIGSVATISEEIFAACKTPALLDAGEHAILVIKPLEMKVQCANVSTWRSDGTLEIVLPLMKCINELLHSLRDAGDLAPQISLPFPLAAVSVKA